MPVVVTSTSGISLGEQRVLQAAPAVLSATMRDQDGTAVDAGGAVTVAVYKSDGTVVLAPGTATSHSSTGVYTVALAAAQTAHLDVLIAVWSDGAAERLTTYHEIVGGYFFSVADIRASDPTLVSSSKYPESAILTARQEVENEAERICGVAFVPRFARIVVWGDGTDRLELPHRKIRAVRSLAWGGLSLSATALANLAIEASGTISRYWPLLASPTDDSLGTWQDRFPAGFRITLGYEHGFDSPPADVRRAAFTRLRNRLNATVTGIPDRAVSFSSTEGGTFALSSPGEDRTGIPEVDAVYQWYRRRYRPEMTAGTIQVG